MNRQPILCDMNAITVDLDALPAPPAVPCAARPWSGFIHLDGVCACFYGGPAPVFAEFANKAA